MPTHSKDRDLQPARSHPEGHLTSNQGLPIGNDDNSLRADPRGPALLEDFLLREKITHFDHERIPERAVHARGSAAHGHFQVHAPLTELSCAKFLADPGKKTPVFVRFSTVAGSRGSADTARDARGFAVKFYTEDGNFDLVGNNIPVFFIQDAIKFPDLIHAVKPEPHHEMPQAASAHDTFYDFMWLTPEATHMLLWVMSDRGIPRSLRMMDGFGVNTYRLIDAEGRARLVKFHWKPRLGVHSLVWDEAQKLAGVDADFHRRDLWEAIDRGDFPVWDLALQIIEEADEHKFPFDPLDATKLWPESLVPLRRVGTLTLDRNPDNFFAETEQVAFCPANLVPGIDFSDDPLLQGRLFSYLDTQLSRLGSPNFHELPINRPLCPMHNNQRDGHMRRSIDTGRVSYRPSSLAGSCPAQGGPGSFVTHPERVAGSKVRARSDSFADHFSQPALFWRSMSPPEQQHIVDALRFELSKLETPEIRARMVDILANVDETLAHRVAPGIGVHYDSLAAANARLQAGWARYGATSLPGPRAPGGPATAPELSMANTIKDTIATRKVAILVTEGFHGDHVSALRDAIKLKGAGSELVALQLGELHCGGGSPHQPERTLFNTSSVVYDAVYLPGGARSVAALQADPRALSFIADAYRHGKAIAATGEGIDLLLASHVDARLEPALAKQPGLVLERAPKDIATVAAHFIAAIAQHRHFDRG